MSELAASFVFRGHNFSGIFAISDNMTASEFLLLCQDLIDHIEFEEDVEE